MSISIPKRQSNPAVSVLAVSDRTTLRQRVAAALDSWAAGPRRTSNRHWLIYVTVASVVAAGLAWNVPDRTIVFRAVGLLFFAAHMLANKAVVGVLGSLRDRGMPEAGRALRVYLGPGQLTSLDLGLIWVGVAVFAPLLDLVFPA
ncbi:MAG TPA: hypothetical protein VGB82_08300 [Alphaproteobacteria bacterium]